MPADRAATRWGRPLGIALLAVVLALVPGSQGEPAGPGWHVYFPPRGGATQAVVDALTAARASVLVQAYSFTSAPIAKALVEAHKRGVKVEVILAKSNQSKQYSSADFVAHAGIVNLIDRAHAPAHNKVMIIDGETVITGSFNFTTAAERQNAENLLVIHDTALAARYTENWRAHGAHSVRDVGGGATARSQPQCHAKLRGPPPGPRGPRKLDRGSQPRTRAAPGADGTAQRT